MSKGDHRRNPAYSLPQDEYAKRPIWCPSGGMHDRDEDGVCSKCAARNDLHPDLPPNVDLSDIPS